LNTSSSAAFRIEGILIMVSMGEKVISKSDICDFGFVVDITVHP
jgi:hypothetical protein